MGSRKEKGQARHAFALDLLKDVGGIDVFNSHSRVAKKRIRHSWELLVEYKTGCSRATAWETVNRVLDGGEYGENWGGGDRWEIKRGEKNGDHAA